MADGNVSASAIITDTKASGLEERLFDNGTTDGNFQQDNFEFILLGIVTPLMFGSITLIGTIGNCLVIYVILSRSKMRTVTNLLLLNLAIADLLFLIICPPFTAFQLAFSRWPFGNAVCKIMHYFLNVTAYVTVYTLVLISVIRYCTVVYSTQTLQYRTKRNIGLMCITIWTVMLSVNVPILLSYGQLEKKDGTLYCDHFGWVIAQRIFATFFVFAYVVPLFIIAIFSVLILHHIQKSRSTMIDKKTKSQNRKKTASRLLILVVVIFALFWLPVHIHLLVAYFGKLPQSKVYTAISLLWNCLAYFNSCVNPFIYNYASKDFRDSFREVVCCTRSSKVSRNADTVVSMVGANGKESKKLLSTVKGDFKESCDL